MIITDDIIYKKIGSNPETKVFENFGISLPRNNSYLGFCAYHGDKLTGIIILYEHTYSFKLMLLIVKPVYRNNHIGGSLLKLAEANFRDKSIEGFFNSVQHDHASLIDFFHRMGWKTQRCFDKLEFPLHKLPVFFTKRSVQEIESEISAMNIKFIPYNSLDDDKIAQIVNINKQIPGFLDPFMEGRAIPRLSYFILHRDEIIGWIRIDSPKANTLEIPTVYVDPKFRHLNLYSIVVNYSFRVGTESGEWPIESTKIVFNINPQDERINTIYARYLKKTYESKMARFCARKVRKSPQTKERNERVSGQEHELANK